MKDNSFEKDIKQSFDQYEPTLNTDEIWDNIEPKLKKKKKRRFFFWLWFGAIGLIATIGVMLFQQNNSDINNVAIEVDTRAKSKAEQEFEVNKEVQNSLTDKVSTDHNKQTESKSNKVVDVNKNASNIQPQPTTITNVDILQSEVEILNLIPNSTVAKQYEYKSSVSTVIVDKPVVSNEVDVNASLSKNTTAKKEVPLVATNIDEKSSVKTAPQNPVAIDDLKSEMLSKKSKKVKAKDSNSKVKAKKKVSKKKSKKKVKRKKRPKWHYEGQFTIAPILPIRSMTPNESLDVNVDGLLKFRRDHEKQFEAFGVKGSLVFQHRKGMLVTVGLEYQQLNEQFAYNESVEEITEQEVTLTITENQNGEIINSTTGPVSVSQTTIVNQKFANNYRFVNIPIGAGIAWTKKKKHYKLIGGLDYNLMFRFNGAIGAPDDTANILPKRDFDTSTYNSVFKKRTGLGLWIAGEYHHPINNKLSWIIAPKLQIPFTSLTQKIYRLEHRYYKLSLETGINYWLNPVKKKRKF